MFIKLELELEVQRRVKSLQENCCTLMRRLQFVFVCIYLSETSHSFHCSVCCAPVHRIHWVYVNLFRISAPSPHSSCSTHRHHDVSFSLFPFEFNYSCRSTDSFMTNTLSQVELKGCFLFLNLVTRLQWVFPEASSQYHLCKTGYICKQCSTMFSQGFYSSWEGLLSNS